MNKKTSITIISFLILALVVFFIGGYSGRSTKNIDEFPHALSTVSTSGDITCSYPQVLSAYYSGGNVSHELPSKETNPTIFTFSDLNKEISKLKYIDATRTISELSIVKIHEDADRIVLIESSDYYVAIHTIYTKTGVSIYSKQVSLFGIPSGTMSMGTCINS